MKRTVGLHPAALAAVAVKLAAKVAPRRNVDVFTHRMWAAGRPWWHLDVHLYEPGWLFIELGGRTIEVSWATRAEMAAAAAAR